MIEIEQIDNQIKELQEQYKNVKGTETLVYSRVVGYYQPISCWNKGKRQEFEERKLFDLPEIDK